MRTPLKAIRAKCSGGSANEVKLCPIHDCALWPYRFGKRPGTAARKGHDTGERPAPVPPTRSYVAIRERTAPELTQRPC